MPSVNDYADLLGVLANQGFYINSNACLVVRNRNVSCGACVAACVGGCIAQDGRRLIVDTTRCVHCGSCATACPTGAIGLKNPGDKQLLDDAANVLARNGEMVVFACDHIREKAKGHIEADSMVPVTCLSRVDESVLATCASLGAKRIVLVSDSCATCAYAKASALISQVVQCAKSAFSAWEVPCQIKLSAGKFPRICALAADEAYDCERRLFFQNMRDGLKSSGMEAANYMIEKNIEGEEEPPEYEHVTIDGTLPHRLPRHRLLLFDALDLCAKNATGEVSNDEETDADSPSPDDLAAAEAPCVPKPGPAVHGRLFAKVSIDAQACNGCQMCAVFCPTGAIAKHEELDEEAATRTAKMYRAPGNPRAEAYKAHGQDETSEHSSSSVRVVKSVTLLHAPERCVHCGTCVPVCAHHAIPLHAAVEATSRRAGYIDALKLKDISREKGGPDAIRNSMSKLLNSPSLWG